MVEVEVKIPVKNKKQVEEKLLELGFLKGDLLKESDFYFDNAIWLMFAMSQNGS